MKIYKLTTKLFITSNPADAAMPGAVRRSLSINGHKDEL